MNLKIIENKVLQIILVIINNIWEKEVIQAVTNSILKIKIKILKKIKYYPIITQQLKYIIVIIMNFKIKIKIKFKIKIKIINLFLPKKKDLNYQSKIFMITVIKLPIVY